jgi:hypothetical protein
MADMRPLLLESPGSFRSRAKHPTQDLKLTNDELRGLQVP